MYIIFPTEIFYNVAVNFAKLCKTKLTWEFKMNEIESLKNIFLSKMTEGKINYFNLKIMSSKIHFVLVEIIIWFRFLSKRKLEVEEKLMKTCYLI